MSDIINSPEDIFRNLVQVGIVVDDIDRTIKVLSEVFGIGPFRTISFPPPDRDDINLTYNGQPGNYTARLAFTQLGSIELELIQPLEGESTWADFLTERGEGIHHIRFNVPDVKPVINYLAGHGIKTGQTGTGLRPGTSFVYFDTDEKIGFTIEILNTLPGTNGYSPQIVNGRIEL